MSDETFEIGLVGAGAISAGAYTAGVIDFLVQALDEWYRAKDAGESVPAHDVKLSVFSGASAGAITAVLGAAYLASDQPPLPTPDAAAANDGRNKLWDCWVDRIDIEHLLGRRDLEAAEAPVASVLDSTVLGDIARVGLDVRVRAQRRRYVGDPFELVATVTNIRGVPYVIPLEGHPAGHTMSLHADYMHFELSDSGQASAPDRYGLRWSDLEDPAKKAPLAQAALASGAFPVGLAPRALTHTMSGSPDLYSARKWRVPQPDSNPHQCFVAQSIEADWKLPRDYKYEFLCVDGGVMNNEPLELARELLAGEAGYNPRGPDAARRALVMIDPFPSESTFDLHAKPESPDLLNVLFKLFGALKNQARFKPEELALAAHPQIYSRFMIAPSRGGNKHTIACGSLGGFGGFLKHDFRAHDFFLGRRNTQKFLRDHFALLETNPLFKGWGQDTAMKDRFCVRRNGAPEREDGKLFLPIIPLVGAAARECYDPEWPHYLFQDLDNLSRQLDARLDIVLERLVAQYFKDKNWFMRLGAQWFLGSKKSDLRDEALKRVEADLQKMGLMAPRPPAPDAPAEPPVIGD
ncbi:MAG TPA: patatin-like phospholipase family protein [Burkholderiales bacterium]|nr:patatin-like phospholipase family protein [Burkholderiales bacterium]